MQSTGIIRCFSSTVLVEIIIFMIVSCFIFLPAEAHKVGFSTELIHRDSPLSPFFHLNLSHSERMEMADRRSLHRRNHNQVEIGTSNLIADAGLYLMKIAYGTPAVESYSIVDTGSSLSWIQCEPCTNCYPSETPPFKPENSRTFQYLSCDLKKCLQLNDHKNNNSCKHKNAPCPYEQRYWDGSYSRGEYASDTITVGSQDKTVIFPKFYFGCGHDNGGNFPYKGAGLVGFGPEEESFLYQLRAMQGGKFSHCFAPVTSDPAGRISFGTEAVVSGPGVISTPLILTNTYFYAKLEGISVGDERVGYSPDDHHHFSSNNSRVMNGIDIIIDTGVQTISLPEGLHVQVDLLVQKSINLQPITRLPFVTCYPMSLSDADIPKITFHFQGADLELNPVNTFIHHRDDLRCLAILSDDDFIAFGNTGMINFLVGYDFVNQRLSFKPTDCSMS